MANLPTSNNISHHLTDRTGTPLLSSSNNTQPQSTSQAEALSSLTIIAITAYDTASRLDLGLPQRILIETSSPGPVILHSYLNPQASQHVHTRASTNGRGIVEQAREDLRPLSGTTDSSSVGEPPNAEVLVNGVDYGEYLQEAEGEGAEEEEGNGRKVPPMLVGTVVVATSADAGEARRTATRLERMAREVQRELARELDVGSEPATVTGSGEDG
jgi:hypothetical protein